MTATDRVYRYRLPIVGQASIDLPAGARVLSVAASRAHPDGDDLDLWAEVDPEADDVARTFYIHGTGHLLHPDRGEFVGTVQTHGGALVWHVYEAASG